MRNSPHLHERHLLEAIRQKVITHEQYEGIVAIVRSMAHAEGETQVDLGWLSVTQALAAAACVGIPGLYLLGNIERFAPSQVAGASLLGALLSLAAALLMRRQRTAPIASSVLLAGSAAFTWGIVAGVTAEALHGDFWRSGVPALSLVGTSHARLDAILAGDLAVMATGWFMVRRLGVATPAAPATMAFVHLMVEAVHRFVIPFDQYFGDRQAAPFIAGAGLLVMIIARVIDHKDRGRIDAAFWMHTFGLLAVGFGLTTRIDRESSEALIWTLAAVAVIVAGVRWNRRVYLMLGSLAILVWPAMAMGRSGNDGTFIFPMIGSAIAIAVGATWLRANWSRVAPAAQEMRTVWG